jgi:hypothetical protein
MSFVKHLFLFFVLGIGVFAFSNPYERQIKEMIVDGASTRIKLTDNSIWMTPRDANFDLHHWQVEDPIMLENTSNEYFLKNLRTAELLKVFFYNHQDLSQKIYHLQAKSPNGRLLRLEDQSFWRTSYFGSWNTDNWKEMDRVMIFPASDLKGYYLLNLDCLGSNECAYVNYSFNQDQLTYRHFIANIQHNASNCTIQLDNGFVCRLRKTLFGSFDETIANSWQVGDEVNLYCNIRMESRADGKGVDRRMDVDLINLRTLQTAQIFFRKQEEDWKAHKIVQIDGIHSFFNYEIFLTLDDGSYWKISNSDYHVHQWKEGDRVLISTNFYGRSENSHCLLNPDHGMRSYWIVSNYLFSAAQGKVTKMREAPLSRSDNIN